MSFEKERSASQPAKASAQSSSAVVGKTSGTQNLPAAAGTNYTKSDLWPKYKTGNAYADQGVGCSKEGTKGCFLDPDQRKRIVDLYQHRVDKAEDHYVNAVTSVEIIERFKKEPENTNWLVEIAIDLIGAFTLSCLKKGVHALMSGAGEAAAHATVSTIAEAPPEAEAMMELITPLIGIGKKEAGKKFEEHQESEEKAANISFLNVLKNQAGGIYEKLGEDAIANVDDSQLLALFEAFAAKFHTIEAYKVSIIEQLERFQKSGVEKLGIRKNKKVDGVGWQTRQAGIKPSEDEALGTYFDHETRAFWVNTPTKGKRLALYVRGRDFMQEETEESEDFKKFGKKKAALDKFKFSSYVPKEFVSSAIAMHITKFGAPPENHDFGAAEFYKIGEIDEE